MTKFLVNFLIKTCQILDTSPNLTLISKRVFLFVRNNQKDGDQSIKGLIDDLDAEEGLIDDLDAGIGHLSTPLALSVPSNYQREAELISAPDPSTI